MNTCEFHSTVATLVSVVIYPSPTLLNAISFSPLPLSPILTCLFGPTLLVFFFHFCRRISLALCRAKYSAIPFDHRLSSILAKCSALPCPSKVTLQSIGLVIKHFFLYFFSSNFFIYFFFGGGGGGGEASF